MTTKLATGFKSLIAILRINNTQISRHSVRFSSRIQVCYSAQSQGLNGEEPLSPAVCIFQFHPFESNFGGSKVKKRKN